MGFMGRRPKNKIKGIDNFIKELESKGLIPGSKEWYRKHGWLDECREAAFDLDDGIHKLINEIDSNFILIENFQKCLVTRTYYSEDQPEGRLIYSHLWYAFEHLKEKLTETRTILTNILEDPWEA